MARKNICTIMLKEKDLDFVLEAILPKAKDKEGMKVAIREDPQFRDSFMNNDLLFEQLVNSNRVVVGISPMLLFEVLLRRSIKEMEENTHTVERSISQRIPVFDIKETLGFLDEDGVFDYLVDMLASFVFCRKKTTNDIDIDNLIKLGNEIEKEYRF